MIKKFTIHELLPYSQSAEFRNFPVVPISRNRIESYVNNPRKISHLPVLYLYFDQGKMVGFRTILADALKVNGVWEHFGWNSGSWVHPDYRRKGISSILFNEVIHDWQYRLLYTNYAPDSKLLYDKSGHFSLFAEKAGLRLYLRFNFTQWLAPKYPLFSNNKKSLQVFDRLLNFLFLPYYSWQNILSRKDAGFPILPESMKSSHVDFIDAHPGSVFGRTSLEYQWIFKYPWVKTHRVETAEYPFTHVAYSFGYLFFEAMNPEGKLAGLALVKFRDGHLTIPYFSSTPDVLPYLARQILSFAYQQKCHQITVYHSDLIVYLAQKKGIACFIKTIQQKYFMARRFSEKLSVQNLPVQVQDGDGDCIFT